MQEPTIKINGIKYPLNKEQDKTYYRGEWLEVYEDQDGGFYICPSSGGTVLIDSEDIKNESYEK